MSILTIILVLTVFLAFFLMTKGWVKQEVAVPLLALVAIALAGTEDGMQALHDGFGEFSRIALLFTAVAVPAHMLQRSQLLDLVGMRIGELIGDLHAQTKLPIVFLVPALSLTTIYIMAALFHNTTSILVGSVIAYVICKSYNLDGLPVLSGALVASNLGGFSTRWGDTPNIVEANQWNLVHMDFFREIMPINISALVILILTVSLWLRVSMRRRLSHEGEDFVIVHEKIGFRHARNQMRIDRRLMYVGLLGLALAILGPLFFLEYEVLFSSLAIAVSVLLDYSEHRTETLLALGIETYATLASIFVLAQILSQSGIGIGGAIRQWLVESGMSVWAIAIASYFGTLLTEAASWASVAAPIVHSQTSAHVAAWALGAGIFAGSSSLVTAASAGIILTQETKGFAANSRVTFGSYVAFGLPFSLLMLGYYIAVLSFSFN